MDSKFEANLNGETLLVTMTGEVTGQSQLPNIKDVKARKMMIDLAGLKYINSGGVRNIRRFMVALMSLPSLRVKLMVILVSGSPATILRTALRLRAHGVDALRTSAISRR